VGQYNLITFNNVSPVTLTGGSDPVVTRQGGSAERAVFQLNIRTATGLVTDTCDVYIQHSVDGVRWDDIVHFPQRTGTGGVTGNNPILAHVNFELPPTTPIHAAQDAALAANTAVQGPIGQFIRAKAVLAGTGTFAGDVQAYFNED